MNSYADALESYLIPAEEGFMDKVKSAGKWIIELFKKSIKFITELIKKLFSKQPKKESNDETPQSESSKLKMLCMRALSETDKTMENYIKLYTTLNKVINGARFSENRDNIEQYETLTRNNVIECNNTIKLIEDEINSGASLSDATIKDISGRLKNIVSKENDALRLVETFFRADGSSEEEINKLKTPEGNIGMLPHLLNKLSRTFDKIPVI